MGSACKPPTRHERTSGVTKEELRELLKENLTVNVFQKTETDWESGEIRVTISFDGETICEDFDYVFNR